MPIIPAFVRWWRRKDCNFEARLKKETLSQKRKRKEKNWGRMLRKGVYRKIVEISNKKEFIKIKPEN
jgi:hypothetical protein